MSAFYLIDVHASSKKKKLYSIGKMFEKFAYGLSHSEFQAEHNN